MKSIMLGFVYAIVVVGITAGSGLLVGQRTNRWGVNQDITALARKLEQIPKNFGQWELISSDSINPEATKILQCDGHVLRKYVGEKSGGRVTVAVLLGPAGPISLHDPDVCYVGAGYEKVVEPERQEVTVGDQKVSLWSVTLRAKEVGVPPLRVVWGWNDGTGWKSPDHARLAYAGRPYLYKVQAVHEADNESRDGSNVLTSFLADFLPQINQQLPVVEAAGPKA